MRTCLPRRQFLTTLIVLVVVMALSLFLRLDFANAKLILTELRIPRLILAIGIGGALALSGSVMQTVLGNPLAEPYTLGVASGAALGAAVFSSLGLHFSLAGINAGGMIGSVAVVWALFKISSGRGHSSESLILTGVMLSLTCASMLAIWMALADPLGVQSINFWLLGDLSRVSLVPAIVILVLSLTVLGYFIYFARRLDAFLMGIDGVPSFGVSLDMTLRASVLLLSVLIGFCVSAAGVIGFLGLIIPHVVRRKLGTSIHSRVLPMVYVWGAIVLIISDTLARVVSDPHELPVGAVTALVGAPMFILIYRRQRHEVDQ
ncbi:MAG: iron ABC transporter permease [Bdellovibrionales bacterium]|nr:iron ABC transporter permease [Bdellovibrionales bacterium]